MEKLANLKINIETREALKAIGRKGETYDAIIRRLLKQNESQSEGAGRR